MTGVSSNQKRARKSDGIIFYKCNSFVSKVQGYEAAIQEAKDIIKNKSFAKTDDTIVVVAGMPFGISGSTNSIRVVDI